MSTEPWQGRRQPATPTTNRKDENVAGKRKKRDPDAPQLHKVRTTIEPGKVIEVGDAELTDLTRQGLIYDGKAPAEPEADEADTTDNETGGP